MPDICLYFQVHQPNRLLPRDLIPPGDALDYEDDALNAAVLSRVSDQCYLPANRMFKRLIEKHGGRFRMALSISGAVIDQMERHRPDVLESFRELVAAGGVELLAETYYHSLAFVHSNKEFDRQVDLHLEKLEDVFHVRPRVFRNTELIYTDAIAAKAETMGFDGVLAKGWSAISRASPRTFSIGLRKPRASRRCCATAGCQTTSGFRFSDPNWQECPLTPEKFAAWLADSPGDVVNLFMGYETIGEHQGAHTGIFEFWERPAGRCGRGGTAMGHADRGGGTLPRVPRIFVPFPHVVDGRRARSSPHGRTTTCSAKRSARVQRYGERYRRGQRSGAHARWANMQTSNHFHWMSTKAGVDGGATHRVPIRVRKMLTSASCMCWMTCSCSLESG